MKQFASIMLGLACICNAQATDYFISPNETARLATILNDGTLKPGDNVILRDGTYNSAH